MRGVVACPQPEAADVGRRTLLAGGNAVDAAIATGFAQFAVDPQMCGIGGFGVMQVYHAPSGDHVTLEFLGRAPLKATPDMFVDKVKRRLRFDQWEMEGRVNEIGHLAVACPGTVLGFWEAHRRYGSLPWAELARPAVRLLEEGFPVPGELADLWRRPPTQPGASSMLDVLSATEASRKIYVGGDGQTRGEGRVLRNPDYARALQEIAEKGPGVLYTGWMADRIAEEFAANGGLLSKEDLAQYRVGVGEAVEVDYRGHVVAGVPPPSSGVQVAQILRILEGYEPSRMGSGTAEFLNIMALAQKASFSDRAGHLGDPAFQDVPVEEVFLSSGRAAEWRRKIDAGEPFDVAAGGVESRHTTTVSAIDGEGTAAALTHTLATPASGVVVDGLGFMFNNAMHMFDPHPGRPFSIAPGKARISAMTPTLVFRDGRPWAAVGAPGATKIPTGVLQAIVNMVDFGMSPVEAVSAPRVHCEGGQVDVEARVYFGVKDELEAMGHTVSKSGYSYDPFFSLVHVAAADQATGRLGGAADPRGRGGLAVVD
jgi:gamma-glutamyltranspeptidase/glutathione hydrolase